MRHISQVSILAIVSFCIGCGGEQGAEGTVTATGTVIYEGQPVEDATVTFKPAGEEGRAASGTTDAEGKFELSTLAADDGVVPGTYEVAISKTVIEGGLDGEDPQAYFEEHGRPPRTTRKELLPVKYKNAETAGLTAEVTEDGENHFPFELTD